MDHNYVAGDYIIDNAYIYEITSVTFDGGKKGNEALIHYKPIRGTDKVFTASIPEKNFGKVGLRKLLNPEDINVILCKLTANIERYSYNAQETKEILYLNEPANVMVPLKYLWKCGDKLAKTDTDIREEMIQHLCMEIAFVTKQTTEVVRAKIEKILNK
ncbi:hypothetical protein M1116_03955 [Patescibacteria group bacterium]|nr:hypothetical protein [Patescibacteria group bacterium]